MSAPTPQLYYIYSDHLNTPRLITDTSNTPVWRYDQADPFNATQPNDDPTNSGKHFVFNLRFPGRYYDQETGLHYNYFRNYDPRTGRYVQSDPIGLAGGTNTYAYVENNPLSYVDPLGLWAIGDTLPQSLVDSVAGFGDAFLVPELIRDALNIDGGINKCSTFYRAGKATGFVWGSAPFALRGASALGATRFGHTLNHNHHLRTGPGRIPANGPGLPAGTDVPRMSIGPQIKGGPPNPHLDLRSRIPYAPPIGGPAECGCP